MRLLHTSDWHVGRTIRGRSRADEHRAVLAELVELAAEQAVDLVVVAGDQFDVQAPSPEAEQIVWSALQRLAEVAPVVVIAGNHDNPRRLEAVKGLLSAHRIHAAPETAPAADGGVVRVTAADGVEAAVALLPFLHHRNVVRAVDLLDPAKGDSEHGQAYADRYARLGRALAADLGGDVSLLVGHVTCVGGVRGGGEREAHSIERYSVDPRAFPLELDYVALGHLHRAQDVGSAPPVHYSGAPLMLDFSESDKPCSAAVVDLEPGRPARITDVPLTAGRPLTTLRGTVEEVLAHPPVEAWTRVLLTGAVPAGVGETIRDRLGERVVDVRVDRPDQRRDDQPRPRRLGRPPQELFAAFLAERGIDDRRIPALFAELLEVEGVADAAAAVVGEGSGHAAA